MNILHKRSIDDLFCYYLRCKEEGIRQAALDAYINDSVLEKDYAFSTGLLGAAWMIAYLQSHGILNTDIDDILYEVDDNIYKIAINSVSQVEPDIENILDLIRYYHQRLLLLPSSYNFYRRFSLNECLKLLLNKLIKLVENRTVQLSDFQMSKIVLKFSYLITTSFCVAQIEKFFYDSMENLLSNYKMKGSELQEDDIEALYYLLFSAKQYGSPYWSTVITQMLNCKINSNCVIDLLKKIDLNFFFNKANLLPENYTNSNAKNYMFLFLSSNLYEMDPKYLFDFKA